MQSVEIIPQYQLTTGLQIDVSPASADG